MTKRTIHSDYYFRRKMVATTRSVYAVNAVKNATGHLTTNHFGADRVDIYDDATGTPIGQFVVENWLGSNGRKPKLTTTFEHEGIAAIRKEASGDE